MLNGGTNFTSGNTLTSYASHSNTNGTRAGGTTLALGANIGETIQFTGIQVEVGSVATPFEHRSVGEELALCQRYYVEEDGISMRNFTGGTIAVSIPHFWKTTIRATPSITGTNATANESISTRGFQAYKGTIGSGASWQLTGTKATAEL